MWWIINIGGLIASWHYTNLASESAFYNTVCPIFVGIFLISTLLKVAIAMGGSSGRGGHGGGGDGGGFFGGCGGDGGGGGDGGC